MGRYLALVGTAFILSIVCKAQSFKEALYLKEAQLDLYWNTSEPFIFYNSEGELAGVEFENILLFKEYLFDKHDINLRLNWIEIETFESLLDTMVNSEIRNRYGVSAFSITPERLEKLKMTDSYLSDIVVFVSSSGTPIVTTTEEVYDLLKGKTAITIKATIYEEMLYGLRNRLGVDFEIAFIDSHESVVGYIGSHKNCFGFIDLPIYLNLVRNGRGSTVTRQNLFTQQGTGYGYIMPLNSDWKEPFDEFLADPHYQRELANIISTYFGKEYLEFIDKLFSGEELGTSILTEEKELQLALIENANLKLEKEETISKVLLWGIVVTTLFLLIIGVLFLHNNRNVKLLLQKKKQIESQKESIRNKNDRLTRQNEQLIGLNEEKNNLVKILAHDMRAPLAQVISSVDILNDPPEEFTEEQSTMLLNAARTSAKKADEMIKRILDVDVLENKKKLATVEDVNVNQVLVDTFQRYEPVARKKEINLEKHLLNDEIIIVSDNLLLTLVIENLVSNAIKFSKANTTITLSVSIFKTDVLFKVADQGPGFTKEDKRLIFNRFQRLSAKPTGGEHSIGLGLSIVKKYVSDLGGHARVESEVGKGSTFYISIPNKPSALGKAS